MRVLEELRKLLEEARGTLEKTLQPWIGRKAPGRGGDGIAGGGLPGEGLCRIGEGLDVFSADYLA